MLRTRKRRWKFIGTSSAAIAMTVLVIAVLTQQPANAFPPYLDDWMDMYPESTLPDRMEQQIGSSCYICHSPAGFSIDGNCYREDIRDLLSQGNSILEALEAAHLMDSDGDGVTNGEQITMPHAQLRGEVGYNPGLSGCFGNDPCGPFDDIHLTGVAESPMIEPVIGDLNCDGVVDVFDLLILIGEWGDCPEPPFACIADLNDDGVVDVFDLLILIGNWG